MKWSPLFILFFAVSIFAYERGSETNLKTQKQQPKWTRPTTLIENIQWDIDLKNTFYDAYLLQFRDKKIKVDSPQDKELTAKLNKILRRLKLYSLLPDLPMEVHLVDDPYVNAECLPGGGILFFKGLFDPQKGLVNAKDEDEIAAVMAHEMSHATLRHTYRQSRNMGSVAAVGELASLGMGMAAGDKWGQLFPVVYYPAMGLYFLKYSRAEESQADLEGLYTMMKAGYDPKKMIAIWARAARETGSRPKHSIFDTHPSNGERAKTLAEYWKQISLQR